MNASIHGHILDSLDSRNVYKILHSCLAYIHDRLLHCSFVLLQICVFSSVLPKEHHNLSVVCAIAEFVIAEQY